MNELERLIKKYNGRVGNLIHNQNNDEIGQYDSYNDIIKSHLEIIRDLTRLYENLGDGIE